MSCDYKSVLRCASLSAFESALFELLGQLYPARFFFWQAKKKSPKASKATNEAVGPNAHAPPEFLDVRQDTGNLKSNWYYYSWEAM